MEVLTSEFRSWRVLRLRQNRIIHQVLAERHYRFPLRPPAAMLARARWHDGIRCNGRAASTFCHFERYDLVQANIDGKTLLLMSLQ